MVILLPVYLGLLPHSPLNAVSNSLHPFQLLPREDFQDSTGVFWTSDIIGFI